MANSIVREIKDSVEFFTVVETGESGMSVSGLAKLCGVSKQAISKLLSDLSTKSPAKRLDRLVGKALDLSTNGVKRGGRVRILSAEACALIIKHYAFEGKEEAEFALDKFTETGINLWIQSITGWNQKAAETSLYLLGIVLTEPKDWERHFSAEWEREAVRLTGYSWDWSCMSRFINLAVYEWMPEEVRAELDRCNPPTKTGKRKSKQHQHFSEEAKPVLKSHISEVLTLMKMSDSVQDLKEYMNRRWAGRYQLRLAIEEAA